MGWSCVLIGEFIGFWYILMIDVKLVVLRFWLFEFWWGLLKGLGVFEDRVFGVWVLLFM